MNDIKDIKKFDDDSIEVLSIEDLCEDKEAHHDKKGRQGKKIFLIIAAAVCILIICGVSAFLAFRSIGERSMKAEAADDFILYNGKKYQYREEVINILCLGIDKSEAMEKKIESRDILGMADAVIVASIDTEKNTLQMIAIPRDTMTNVTMTSESGEITGKEEMELCYQYGYGKRAEQSGQLMANAVSELLYNVPIEKFCAINFEALPVLNDAIGGVDVVLQEDLAEYEPTFVEGSQLHLEGEYALKFVRVRNRKDIEGVYKRTQRQKQYAIAFLEKAKSVVSNDISLPVKIFQEMQENMSTNITVADITYLVPELLDMSVSEDVVQMLPGESVAGEEFLEFHVDKAATKEMVINTFYKEVE